MVDLQQMTKRQRVLGDFGAFALQSEDLDAVLTEACRLVGEALDTTNAKVLEIQEDGCELLVRAGVGWGPDVVGQVRLPMRERSSETFSIREGKPVVSQDIGAETRFDVPPFMRDAGVVAMVNVPIVLPGRKPYGLLQVDAVQPRDFGQADIDFLRTYAAILGPVIDRLRKVRSLRTSEQRFRLIVETVHDYAIFTTDAQDRIDGWFAGAEAVFGWTAAEAMGKPGGITFTPEDRQAHVDEAEVETARREGSALNVRWHVRKDGKRVFIEGAIRVLHDEAGRVQGFVRVGQDVTERREADERLRYSEERLAAIFTHAPVGLSEIDRDGRFRRVNAELCRILGRSEPALLDLGMVDVTLGEDLPASLDALSRASRTRGVVALDKRYRRPDDSLVWATSSIMRLTSGQDAEGLLVVTSDLTERRASESAQRESEARLAAAFESVPVGVAVIDLKGAIVTSNRVYRRFLPTGLIPSQDPSRTGRWRAWDLQGQAIAPRDFPGARALRGERTIPGQEMLFTDDDGREIWTSVSTVPIHDMSGRLTGQASVIGDIDALKRGADALRKSEARLLTLVEGIPQLVWRAVDGGAWTWASPQWTAYTGLSDAASRDWGWLAALHPEDRADAHEAWVSARAGEPLTLESRVYNRAQGRYRWFQTRATPVRDSRDRVLEWLGTSTDIDDLRAYQERQRVLVAELQHRTRNLLGVVRSIAGQTLRASTTLPEFQAAFDDRLGALSRVQGLLSRAEGEPITLGALIHSELDAMGGATMAERITVDGPEVSLRKRTVETFALALHELATNARKYGALATEQGRLRIRWTVRDQDGPRLRLEWTEEGIEPPGGEATPASRAGGYGRELIERALPYALGAQTRYDLGDADLRCVIDLALHRQGREARR